MSEPLTLLEVIYMIITWGLFGAGQVGVLLIQLQLGLIIWATALTLIGFALGLTAPYVWRSLDGDDEE